MHIPCWSVVKVSLILQGRSFYTWHKASWILKKILLEKKAPIIWTETFRMVINVSKTFLQTQSFFIVSNQKQMIFILRGTGSRERKLLNFKTSSKTFT